MKIEKIFLVCTGTECPEQYVGYDQHGNFIAYLRLRNGTFTVECPSPCTNLVYKYIFEEDKWKGKFNNKTEKEYYLEKAMKAIIEYYNK